MECPICGETAEKIYYSQDDEIVGCDCCVYFKWAEDVEEEERDAYFDREFERRREEETFGD